MTYGRGRWVCLGAVIWALGGCGDDGSDGGDAGGRGDAGPVDGDGDGVPDVDDPDANGDGILDVETPLGDLDGDGEIDRDDLDVDGDGLANRDELGDDGAPGAPDGDGEPDHRDLDSDDDGVPDAVEELAVPGAADADGDGVPNFRDLDADGDELPDQREIGPDPTTPATCVREMSPAWVATDGGTPTSASDGRPDFLDSDRDNDGLEDGDEIVIGTDPCGWDTDDDGWDDLFEATLDAVLCPRGVTAACDLALDGDQSPGPAIGRVVSSPRGERAEEQRLIVTADLPDEIAPTVAPVAGYAGAWPEDELPTIAPACTWDGDGPLPREPCWIPRSGTSMEDAVASVDAGGFVGAAPGTTLVFRVAVSPAPRARLRREFPFDVLIGDTEAGLFVVGVPGGAPAP